MLETPLHAPPLRTQPAAAAQQQSTRYSKVTAATVSAAAAGTFKFAPRVLNIGRALSQPQHWALLRPDVAKHEKDIYKKRPAHAGATRKQPPKKTGCRLQRQQGLSRIISQVPRAAAAPLTSLGRQLMSFCSIHASAHSYTLYFESKCTATACPWGERQRSSSRCTYIAASLAGETKT